MEQLNSLPEELTRYFVEYGLEVIGAIVILILGLSLSKWLSNRVEQYLSKKEQFDKTLTPLFGQAVKILIITVTILAVLNQFGIETASIIAVLSTIGLAIGLALQGTLSNIASGIMLLILRPFNVGDVVEVGSTFGIVDEIGLFITQMHTFDNVAITVPNSNIWGNEIKNYTQHDIRRVDMQFGISYSDDMDKAMRVADEVLNADERVLSEPEPVIEVNNLGDNSVAIIVRPWTQTDNVWPLRWALIKRIKERFDEEDISFPFPQRDVHFFQEEE